MRRGDAFLLVLCALLVLSGPAMAVQEILEARQAEARDALLGPAAPDEADAGYRRAWRGALLVAILAADVLGSLVLLRIGRQARARAASGRLLALLVLGLAVLDVAFLVDNGALAGADFLGRAAFVAWSYPAGALLTAGSVLRLGEVETLMAPGAR